MTRVITHTESISEPKTHSRVLVVDDVPTNRSVLKSLLVKPDCMVFEAENGVRALDIIENTHLDLVVLDIVMPGMNGRDMAKKISRIRPDIKILFMSGYATSGIVHQGILYKGLNFIKKPFTQESLARKVSEIVNQN